MNYSHRRLHLHSVHLEHRLTVLEVEARVEKKLRAQHGRRITALEAKQQPRPLWTPRDYILTAAGAMIAIAAIFEKIGWATAVSHIMRLYGVK